MLLIFVCYTLFCCRIKNILINILIKQISYLLRFIYAIHFYQFMYKIKITWLHSFWPSILLICNTFPKSTVRHIFAYFLFQFIFGIVIIQTSTTWSSALTISKTIYKPLEALVKVPSNLMRNFLSLLDVASWVFFGHLSICSSSLRLMCKKESLAMRISMSDLKR